MKNIKPKMNFEFILNLSLSINVLSIIIVFFVAYKYYQIVKAAAKRGHSETDHSKTDQNNHATSNQTPLQSESRTQKEIKEKITFRPKSQQNMESLKLAFEEQLMKKDQIIAALQKKLEQSNKNYRQPKRPIQPIVVENTLKQELELQQERSRFLEEKIASLQNQLRSFRQQQQNSPTFSTKIGQKPTLESQALINLRNQLEFCQKRLLVSQNVEKELRLKLQNYQTIGQYSLDHPQYLRLRQMNTRYKQIIANLQTYLLQKNHNNPILNISFNDL